MKQPKKIPSFPEICEEAYKKLNPLFDESRELNEEIDREMLKHFVESIESITNLNDKQSFYS